ncbi:hypothetical protein GYMLUDRAFT_256191 [Collybiopsis luxurians FD-317 M1]|nr:hypothetical protein GYMLUDRAFT_256191 [Collybiopsis luxurians FD-317 M1]
MTTTILYVATVELPDDLARKYDPFHRSYASKLYKLCNDREPLDKDTADEKMSTLHTFWRNTDPVNGRTFIENLSEKENYVVLLQCKAPQVASAPSADFEEAAEEVAEEARDIPGKVEQDFKKFVQRVSTGKTPSVLVQVREYNINQSSVHTAMLDGRFATTGPLTIAPPIEIYHPVFGRFLQRSRQSDLDVPEDVLLHTASLLRSVSRVSVKETPRELYL